VDVDAAEICFRRGPRSCRQAREWIGRRRTGLGAAGQDAIGLLTHELVRNSLEHSESDRVWVTFISLPDSVRVQVTDRGSATSPTVRAPSPFATSGRGLQWVSELADRWGVVTGSTTGVWFQLDRPR
jgi:anti-sigma regulatory factor (Ser/Thr protein kinase)